MKKIIVTAFSLIYSMMIVAQMPGANRGQMAGQGMNMGHFYGKVIDATTNKPLESVSVQLIQNKMDTATKKRKEVVIAGMLTNKKGEFSLENLPVVASFKLLVSGIGYKNVEQKAAFDIKMGGDMSQMMNAVDKDLGNIRLQMDTKQLEEVKVSASAGTLQLGIDRKVFNVEKNITSAGGTAVDVMKSVPSVNVDIDGNVTLRNATPQIFVDGRPSTLTLDQIPADAIQSVEIITNPSAKFDASGGGSGILNIVLKKARKSGYNGNLRANIDSRLKFGLGGDFNVRQGKFNFFGNAMMNQRKSMSTVTSTRTDFLANNTSAFLNQNDKPVFKGHFAFARAGFDFFADNRNTFTLAGGIVNGKFNSRDLINIDRDSNFISYTSAETGVRNTTSEFSFHNYISTLGYKHNFAKAGKEVTADANYSYSKNDNNSLYETQFYYDNNAPKGSIQKQQTLGGGTTKFFTAQTDFTNPVTEKIKLEMGARASIRNYNSFNDNLFYDPLSASYVSISGLYSNYKFQDEVYAAYTTFSQQINKFSYQLGGRIESSRYTGTLINKGLEFKNDYPFSFFPSVFLSQKLTDKQDLQLNYSRKINRPNFFQLIPFIDYSDSLNLSKGNPDLKPEFTNLLELTYQVNLNKGNNILATIYYRNTDNLITRYQFRDKNPNPARTDSVVISSFANASSAYAYGLEVTAKTKITSWWDLVPNINLYNSSINGSNIENSLTSQKISWFGKLNNSFKLPKNYSIQLTGDYQSKTILPPGRTGGGGGMMFGGGQLSTANGYTKPIYGADIAIKKEFLKNNVASLSLSVNDIFRTRIYRNHNESVYFIQDNTRRRDPQVFRLNFNYRFGKFDVSLFKRKNLKAEQEGMQNGMQGVQ